MTTTLADMTREFFDAIFASVPPDSTKKRWLCLARGIDPFFNSKGKYEHREWREKFLWPDQADEATAWIQQWAATCDVYMCPYLMKTDERAAGNAAWRQLVHSDADGNADDIKQKVHDLGGGIIIWSGSPGHGHVYMLLSHVVTQAQHEMLCEGLRDHLGSDAKIRDNDVLRPVWSFNQKPTLSGGMPQIVRPENGYNVASLDPVELGRRLGKDITNTTAPQSNGQPPVAASVDREAIDLTAYPRIDGELQIMTAGDRSQDTYRIGCACRDCGLTLAHFRWAIDQRADLADRANARHDDDVLRVWERVCNEWQAQMVSGAPPSAPPPSSAPSGASTVPPPPMAPAAFFIRSSLLVRALADAVMQSVICGYGFRRFYTYQSGVWVPGDDPIQAEVVRLLGNRFKTSHVTNLLPVIEHTPGLARITDDPLSDWINVPNGMVMWRTGAIVPHDPSYLSTIQLPVEYVPGALCPLFEKFLREVLPADLIDSGFIWELLGYCLYSGNPLHTAILLIGAGRNGKGTLIRVLKALLGAYNCSSVDLYDLADDKFSAADLLGKLANLAGDLDARWMENTARFKKITGEDSIRAQEKYMKSFDFTPWALPFYSTNKAFGSADSSTGWMDRWTVVPFPNNFTGHEDRDLTAKLTSEMELRGILAHAIAALPTLMARGQFLKPQSLIEAKAEFMVASDSLRAWVDEECEIDAAAWSARKPFYLAYRKYAISEGVSSPVGNREFYNRIGQMSGIRTAIRGGNRGFSGVRLKGVSANISP